MAVPAGSQLVIRATGKVRFDIVRHGGIEDAPAEARAPLPAGTEERRLVIKSDGSAAVHGVCGSDLVWNFTAIPDRAPTIELTKDPERQARGALRLDYKMDDDYGVVEAKATFALKDAEPSEQAARARCSPRPTTRWRCRRRAPAPARRRPRTISPSIPGPAPKWCMTLVGAR